MNVSYRHFTAIFSCIIINSLLAVSSAGEALTALLGQYRRQITVLEIGRVTQAFTFQLAQTYVGTYVLMDRKLAQPADRLEQIAYKNIVFLQPEQVSASLLSDLGKCEHFDVAMVHYDSHIMQQPEIVRLLLALGDHIFVEMPPYLAEAAFAHHTGMQITAEPLMNWYYFEMHKTCITKARWTAPEEGTLSYGIVSNFVEKHMAKQSTGTTSSWIPGINLLTFLMLRGVYPTDAMMRKQLKTFKHIEHNDLVIGNIVVQGKRITPIDFGDARRNIDPAVCVKAALKKIINEKRFKKDIYDLLHNYSSYIQRHKRKFKN